MLPKKYSLKTTVAHQGKRLDQVLAEWLPQALSRPLSKAKVRKLIIAGAVYLNSKRVRIASKELMANARIDVYVDLRKLESEGTSHDRAFEMQSSDIMFEDEWIIIVNKPPGLPTQPTLDEARDCLFTAIKRFLAKRDGVVDPYVGLHHRLDRDTSGVILFTKSKEANRGASAMFAQHTAVKVYHALAMRPRDWKPDFRTSAQWTVKNYLGPSKSEGRSSGGKRTRYTAVKSGGNFAHTEFKLIEAFHSTEVAGLHVEAQPLTGRTHQIRIHLAEGGMPILGDTTYGGIGEISRKLNIPRLMLHAVSLTFPHPITQNQMVVKSPLPRDFAQCLKALAELTS